MEQSDICSYESNERKLAAKKKRKKYKESFIPVSSIFRHLKGCLHKYERKNLIDFGRFSDLTTKALDFYRKYHAKIKQSDFMKTMRILIRVYGDPLLQLFISHYKTWLIGLVKDVVPLLLTV